jgi:1,4-dihydroxy-2-naphthoate octaprenyltransferase
MRKRVRIFGVILVVVGFGWVAIGCMQFHTDQYVYWWRRSGQLAAGQLVERGAAVKAMADVALHLDEQHRVVILPALVMLSGAAAILFAGSGHKLPPQSVGPSAPPESKGGSLIRD